MKTSEETLLLSRHFGDKRAVEILAGAGFECIDYSMNDMSTPNHRLNQPDCLEYANALREYGESIGVGFNQAHAPFEFVARDEDVLPEIISLTTRSIQIASILGVDTLIVHPVHKFCRARNLNEMWSCNLKFYETLLPAAQKEGVRICTENLFQINERETAVPDLFSDAERYCKFLDAFDDPYLTACIDVGHAFLIGSSPGDLIRALGHDRLHALHIHDNQAIQDDHTLPYFGKIDWEDVTLALAEIDYDGVFTLESFEFYSRFPDDFLETAAKWQHDMAAYLADKIEEKKKCY